MTVFAAGYKHANSIELYTLNLKSMSAISMMESFSRRKMQLAYGYEEIITFFSCSASKVIRKPPRGRDDIHSTSYHEVLLDTAASS